MNIQVTISELKPYQKICPGSHRPKAPASMMTLKINKPQLNKEMFFFNIDTQKTRLVIRKDNINKTIDGEGITTQLLPPAAKALITKPKLLPRNNKIEPTIIPHAKSVIM